MRLIFFILVLFQISCSVSKDPRRREVRQLQRGKITEDTSRVYALPFKSGKSHLVVQGYFSRLSHKNRIAIDFKMKKRTAVLAARDGVVVRMKEDGNKGGWSKKYLKDGNFIVIQHSDNSRSGYWHLKKNGVLVNLGDSVKRGQVIGLSGNTGYTAFPHLHFMVWGYNEKGQWQQIPGRFQTSKGIKYLRPFHFYRSKDE